MADAWSYLTYPESGDAWNRMYGESGDAWARLPGPTGDAWERLIYSPEGPAYRVNRKDWQYQTVMYPR